MSNRQATLTGTVVGSKPQLAFSPTDNTPFSTFFVEFQEKGRQGRQRSRVEVTAWGNIAQALVTYIDVNMTVLLVGATVDIHKLGDGQDKVAKLTLTELPRVLYHQPEVLGEGHYSSNLIQIVGNLGLDPDVAFFDSGHRVATLSIAARRGKDKPPSWFSVKLWDKDADIVKDHARKGTTISVMGRLSIEQWEEEGIHRSKPVVHGLRFTFLGKSKSVESQSVVAAQPVAQPMVQQPTAVPAGVASNAESYEVSF